jgi:hypothetical protein
MGTDMDVGPSRADSPRRDILLGMALFLGCLAIYHLNGKPQFEVDCITPPYTAWSLARSGSFDLRPHAAHLKQYVGTEIKEQPDGSWIAFRPPGTSLAILPFVAPFAWLGFDSPSTLPMMHVGKLAAAACVALSAVLFFFLVRRWVPSSEWPATVLYALGTSSWSVAGQGSWPHGPALLGVGAGLSLLLPGPGRTPGAGRSAWAGLALGLAMLVRPTTAFFLLASGLALLVASRWRAAFAFGSAAAVPVLLLLAYHLVYFNDFLTGGYSSQGWDGGMPIWQRAIGLLLAPSRGLLVYSPALLFAVPGAFLAWRADSWARVLLASWVGAFAMTWALFARWPQWWAGWCYGPRFFTETMPLLCLLAAFGFALGKRWQRHAASGLIASSVLIHGLGVFGHSEFIAWHVRRMENLEKAGPAMFDPRDSQIEAHARSVIQQISQPFVARKATPP